MEQYKRNTKVLYVDDEAALLSAFRSLLRKEEMQTQVLQDSTQIQAVLDKEGPFAVVFSDQRMPGLDGVGVLEKVARNNPATIRVMVTGYSDHTDTLRAINIGGITSYIPKPWNDDQLRELARECVERYNLAGENKHLLSELSVANKSLQELLDGTVAGTVRLLGDMIQTINPDAGSRGSRIRQLGRAFLSLMPEVPPDEARDILTALDLCYLGIAVLPPWIQVSLNKQGLVALDRFDVAKNHHLLAAGLIKEIPRFENVARILRLQSKEFDGSGDPGDEHVAGENIPLGARLLHILVELERRRSENFRGKDMLAKMLDQPNKFDSKIISRMLNRTEPKGPSVTEGEVEVGALQPGMILLEDVMSTSHQCLLRSGATLSAMSINYLKQWHGKDPIADKLRVRFVES
jgi:response regulator RpfG family c-di-GMP phosphodiesterase